MSPFLKRSYDYALIIGCEIGIFLFSLSQILRLEYDSRFNLLFLVAPLMTWLGIYMSSRLFSGKFKSFGAYILVGLTNTLTDFVIFNLFLTFFGHPSTPVFLAGRVLAFCVALVHSFFWNAVWVFRGERRSSFGVRSATQFTLVTLVGLVINLTISSLINTLHVYVPDIMPVIWANIAVICATGVSLIWNFIGYRYIVFTEATKT